MRNLILTALVSCALLFACSDKNSAPTADLPVTKGNHAGVNIEFSDLYSELEDVIITQAGDDLNRVFLLQLGHLDFINQKPAFDQTDLATFADTYKPMTFDQIHSKLAASNLYSKAVLSGLETFQKTLINRSTLKDKMMVTKRQIDELSSVHEGDFLVQFLEHYNALLDRHFSNKKQADLRDCFNDCKYTNIWYAAYYASYNQILSECPHCYGEAHNYAVDCAWLACTNHCR